MSPLIVGRKVSAWSRQFASRHTGDPVLRRLVEHLQTNSGQTRCSIFRI